MTKMIQVSFYNSPELDLRLKNYQKRTGASYSAAIRLAITKFLDEVEKSE